jgi:hypothetical protein
MVVNKTAQALQYGEQTINPKSSFILAVDDN